MSAPHSFLDLYDFRTRVAAMYRARDAGLAAGTSPGDVHAAFRAERDRLFAEHPQSALSPEARHRFGGLRYFPYNPAMRVEAAIEPIAEMERHEVATGDTGIVPLLRVATARFPVGGQACNLGLYWIDVYGGGFLLPFVDLTAPDETYGGGRYLADTIKGSSLRTLERSAEIWRVELDFNYAYNPSCAYDSRWVCPLAPPGNRLPVRIEAGEKTFTG